MKFSAFIAICLFSVACGQAIDKDDTPQLVGSSYGGGYAQPAAAPAPAAYAPVNVPAPPCPKNYLFSCQPNLTPVPCSAPAPSYGSAGAYSNYAPVYAQRPLHW